MTAADSSHLQKAKKDEQDLKTRSITNLSTDPASEEGTSQVSLNLQEISSGMDASDSDPRFQATQAARRTLSLERNPPLKLTVKAGLTPRLLEFLRSSRHPCLQSEAAWALTDIASGTSEQIRAGMEGGGEHPALA